MRMALTIHEDDQGDWEGLGVHAVLPGSLVENVGKFAMTSQSLATSLKRAVESATAEADLEADFDARGG